MSDQAAVVSILLYGCTTWMLSKRMEKKLDGNYTRMLQAILNKSWKQNPTSSSCTAIYRLLRKLCKLDEPDMQNNAGEEDTNSKVIYSCGPLHLDEQRQDDQLEPIYNSSLPIRDVALKTYRKRWTIEVGGKRRLGRSVQVAWHRLRDDDYAFLSVLFSYSCWTHHRVLILGSPIFFIQAFERPR